MTIAISILSLLIAVIFHEVAHGYVAYRFGDPTAKLQGRISLNPLVHIDWLGSIILPGILILSGAPFLIGWAKPVPINPNYFQNPLRDMMWVAIAGPLTNITIALIASTLLKFHLNSVFDYFLAVSISINIVLALFNLFPIPPLDGSRILMYIAPKSLQQFLTSIEPYGLVILFFLVYLNVFEKILPFLIHPILEALL